MVDIAGYAATAGDYITILLFLGIIFAGLIFFLFIRQFKHRFTIYEITKDGVRVFEDKAREYKNKEGVQQWQLLKFKKRRNIQSPPAGCMRITTRGNLHVQAYYDETKGFIYIDPNLPSQKAQENDIVQAFGTLSSDEIQFLLDEYRSADSMRQQSTFDKILQMAPALLSVMVVAMLLIFGGDIVQKFNEGMESQARIAEQNRLALESWQAVIQGTQVINAEERKDLLKKLDEANPPR